MAITLTTDMKYTRPGEGTESNVLSAHNPLIWEFQDGAIAANPSATIQFVVKNNAASTIYTSDVFSCYLLSYVNPVARFRFDATQIIKHIINNYFYKETSEIIEPENYGSKIEVTIISYDNLVTEDTELLYYFASHAVNQIGDEYGSNIPKLFYKDTEEVAHFLDFPNHLFFYSPTNLTTEDPVLEIYNGAEITELITTWINYGDSFDTLTTVGAEITSAIDNGATAAIAQSNVFTGVLLGDYFIFTGTLTQTSGTRPEVEIHEPGIGAVSAAVQLAVGANTIVLKITKAAIDLSATCRIFLDPGAATNFSIADVSFVKTADMSIQAGTLGLYLHDWNLEYILMDETIIQAKALYDEAARNIIKTYNITVFQPCENAVYIRWLTKDGYYMYWAFSPYPYRSTSGNKLGDVINSFSEMALAQSRNFPIGYRDVFNKISAIASAVPILFRRKMLGIFTSPAVYLWNGLASKNLITSDFYNSPGNPWETLITTGVVITSAINTTGSAYMFSSAPYFAVSQGETIVIFFKFKLNSGALPSFRIVEALVGTNISNIVVAADGFNSLEFTITADCASAQLMINVATNSNLSTSAIIIKRKEVELDWVLLDRVEGSHDLKEKMKHDNFECALVLPKNYTQTLSGQNL